MSEVYIIGAKRTPIGSFNGVLSGFSATELGSIAIRAALSSVAFDGIVADVGEVLFGNVLSANLGQAPARQAALGAGIGDSVPCTTVNKVCSSGLKAITLGAQAIALGQQEVVVAGGMESMSGVPYYLPKARTGYGYGHGELVDGLLHDGLWEVYNGFPMGNCAEHIAKELSITREAQDAYAVTSYERAASATEGGLLASQLVPITTRDRKNPQEVTEDEEFRRVKFAKFPTLRPVFDPSGTVTAANASTINDGAAAVVLASAAYVREHNIRPLGRIVSYADAAQAPLYFTTSPALALRKAAELAALNIQDLDYFEVNDAFSVVALANQQLLDLPSDRLNVWGGAVALGHPLGCSGARLVVNLLHILANKEANSGAVSICNGGGGASALILDRTTV